MLDRYWWGTVSSISPESPSAVVRHERSTLAAGGAGNVAANIADYREAHCCRLDRNEKEGASCRRCSVAPEFRQSLITSMKDRRRLRPGSRPASTWCESITRMLFPFQTSRRGTFKISSESSAKGHRAGHLRLREGLLSTSLLSKVSTPRGIAAARAGDPKGVDYKRYRGATLITPNRSERCMTAA